MKKTRITIICIANIVDCSNNSETNYRLQPDLIQSLRNAITPGAIIIHWNI